MFAHLTRDQRLLLTGSVGGVVFTFLPWYHWSYQAASDVAQASFSSATSGFEGWGILYLIAALLLATFLVLRLWLSDTVPLPDLPFADSTIHSALAATMLITILLYWISPPQGIVNSTGYSVGLTWGWFIAFVATIVTVLGAFPLIEEKSR